MSDFRLEPCPPDWKTKTQYASTKRWRSKNPGYQKEWRRKNPEKAKAIQARAAVRLKPTRQAWESKNKAKRHGYHLKRRFGIDRATYEKMLADQGGACGICGSPPKGRSIFDVDHCHKTGRIRGLLCNPCNRTLGHIERYFDDRDRWDRWLAR